MSDHDLGAHPPAPNSVPAPGIVVPASPQGVQVTSVVNTDVAKFRRTFGYVLIAAVSIVVTFAVFCSVRAIDQLRPISDSPTIFDYVRLGVHGMVTVAFVLFCYVVMQAGERLALPAEWVRTSEDLRMLLGVKAPTTLLADDLAKVLQAVAQLAGATSESAKPKKETAS